MRRVFVSYSRQNLEAVTQLITDMQAVGIDTWHDQTLTGGQRWWDNILANIRECDIFVFALSPESWDSEACKSELGYVMKLRKPILPVLVANLDHPEFRESTTGIGKLPVEERHVVLGLEDPPRRTLTRKPQRLARHHRVFLVGPHVELLNLVPRLRLVDRAAQLAEP